MSFFRTVNLFNLLIFLMLSAFIFISGCNKGTSPNGSPEIHLKVADVGVTEAWLKLAFQIPDSEFQIAITRDDSVIKQYGNLTTDTLIYDSGLLPNHDYTYTATLLTSNQKQITSSQITTMDTTSHAFTWQTWTFGAKGSSVLHDCAIISHDNIWCVGEIYTEDTYTYDSLGNWIDPYNAIHWNGSKWELKRILYQGVFWTIEAIYAFSENDIWFEPFVHWDGNEFIEQPIPGILIGKSINKMWGILSNDLYIVGNNGLIAHYNGQTWQRIESGTGNNIHDIWGIYDEEKNEKIILITARNKILRITNENQVGEFDWPFSQNILVSIWFNNLNKIFACGDGAFQYSEGRGWEKILDLPNYFKSHVRGTEINDVFIAGSFGLVAHYNGLNWKVYPDVYNALYLTVDYKENLLVAVGERNSQAVILQMSRN